MYENLSNQRSDSQNEHTGIQRRYLHPQGNCSSWSAKTLSPPQNKYLHWQSCPQSEGWGGFWHRCRCLIWCEQTSPHTSQFGSPQLVRMAGKMSVARLQKSKFRLTEFVSGPAGWHERAATNSLRKESAGLEWHVREGWLPIEERRGRGEERLLWSDGRRKVSDLVRIQTGVGICLALIWHQYLCPHLCSLSVRAIPGPVSLRLWQCLFGLC